MWLWHWQPTCGTMLLWALSQIPKWKSMSNMLNQTQDVAETVELNYSKLRLKQKGKHDKWYDLSGFRKQWCKVVCKALLSYCNITVIKTSYFNHLGWTPDHSDGFSEVRWKIWDGMHTTIVRPFAKLPRSALCMLKIRNLVETSWRWRDVIDDGTLSQKTAELFEVGEILCFDCTDGTIHDEYVIFGIYLDILGLLSIHLAGQWFWLLNWK